MKIVRCYDCGLEYGSLGWIESIIPDHVWNRIKPEGCANGCGILCIICISKRLAKLEVQNIPVWLCGMEPLKAHAGDSSDELELLRNYDISYTNQN
jgi:hypothetical protein